MVKWKKSTLLKKIFSSKGGFEQIRKYRKKNAFKSTYASRKMASGVKAIPKVAGAAHLRAWRAYQGTKARTKRLVKPGLYQNRW